MKKVILSASVILIAAFTLKAQSVNSGNNNTLASSYIITNHTQDVWGDVNDAYLVGYLKVKNTTGTSKTVGLTRSIIDTVTGTINSFCWGQYCWPENIYVSPQPCVIPAGVSDSTFRGDYTPFGKVGTTKVRYLFYTSSSTSDSISVTINYHITPTGIGSKVIAENKLTASPNPANSMTMIGYTLSQESQSGKILIHNMLGSVVEEINLTDKQSSILLMTDGYKPGVYFYTLLVDNKTVSTKKLVVAR